MSNSYGNKSKSVITCVASYAEELAMLAVNSSFSELRFHYLTTHQRSLDPGYDLEFYENFRYLPAEEGGIPHVSEILSRWNDWVNCKEATATFNILGDRQVNFFLQRVQTLLSEAKHPYDKTGAILTVFKEYKAALEQKTGRYFKVKHARLRNDLTDFLNVYSSNLIYNSNQVLHPKGLGQAYSSEYYQARDAAASISVKQTTEVKTQISRRLGAAIKAIPPALVQASSDFHGGAIRMLYHKYDRKPDAAYVLEHYLITNSEGSWNRAFFVDAVLRKLPNVITKYAAYSSPDSDAQGEVEYLQKTVCRKLKPSLADPVFQKEWAKIERNAWADYRRTRATYLAHTEGHGFCQLNEPSTAEKVQNLRANRDDIFDSPYKQLDPKAQIMLLNRAHPGLGTQYGALRSAQAALDLSEAAVKDTFRTLALNESAVLQEGALPGLPDSIDV